MEIMQFLKTMFIQEFNVNNIGIELLDIVEENKLKDYIYRQFKENIMYGEIFRIFKDSGLISENIFKKFNKKFDKIIILCYNNYSLEIRRDLKCIN